MKFLDQHGMVVEGTLLTDMQIAQREQFIKFVHEKVCRGSRHSDYERRNDIIRCEVIANFFVTNFTLQPHEGVSFEAEIDKAAEENAPQGIESA